MYRFWYRKHRDQWVTNRGHWELREIQSRGFLQIGHRVFDGFSLRGRSRFGIERDKPAFFGVSENCS